MAISVCPSRFLGLLPTAPPATRPNETPTSVRSRCWLRSPLLLLALLVLLPLPFRHEFGTSACWNLASSCAWQRASMTSMPRKNQTTEAWDSLAFGLLPVAAHRVPFSLPWCFPLLLSSFFFFLLRPVSFRCRLLFPLIITRRHEDPSRAKPTNHTARLHLVNCHPCRPKPSRFKYRSPREGRVGEVKPRQAVRGRVSCNAREINRRVYAPSVR